MPDFEIRRLEPRPTLAIRADGVTPERIPVILAEILPAVWQFAESHGAQIAGPPYVRYHNMTTETFDLEGGIPVAAPVDGDGHVVATELPGGDAAVGFHIGPYRSLGETYDALTAWAIEQGRQPSGGAWEVYWSDPGETPEDQLRTEVFLSLAP